jgi:hemerythrin
VLIRWHDEYSVGVQRVDGHHRRLFEIANSVLEQMDRGCPPTEVAETLGLLREYARFHFGDEEALLIRYKSPEIRTHRTRHARMLDEVEAMREMILTGRPYSEVEVLTFLQEWLVGHTLSDDRRAGTFLNSKGLY